MFQIKISNQTRVFFFFFSILAVGILANARGLGIIGPDGEVIHIYPNGQDKIGIYSCKPYTTLDETKPCVHEYDPSKSYHGEFPIVSDRSILLSDLKITVQLHSQFPNSDFEGNIILLRNLNLNNYQRLKLDREKLQKQLDKIKTHLQTHGIEAIDNQEKINLESCPVRAAPAQNGLEFKSTSVSRVTFPAPSVFFSVPELSV